MDPNLHANNKEKLRNAFLVAEKGTMMKRLKFSRLSKPALIRLNEDHLSISYTSGEKCMPSRFKKGYCIVFNTYFNIFFPFFRFSFFFLFLNFNFFSAETLISNFFSSRYLRYQGFQKWLVDRWISEGCI